MRVAIVDDNEIDRLILWKLVSDYCRSHRIQVEVVAFSQAEDLLAYQTQGVFEIVFLCIDCSDSSIEETKRIHQRWSCCQLVFVSIDDKLAIVGYDLGVAYYLMKPFDLKKTERALDLCGKRYLNRDYYIEIISSRMPIRILRKNILYVDTFQNAVQIHTKKDTIKTYRTFQVFSECLRGDRRFLFCYKGCAINMDHVVDVTESDFLMDNGDRISIRKRGGSTIRKEYQNYIFSGSDESDHAFID